MEKTQNSKVKSIISLVLKAVAVGMSAASIVLGYLEVADLVTQVTLLSIGLFTLSVAALQRED